MHKYGAVLYEIIVPVNVHFLGEILWQDMAYIA